jgi:hypothetical protein
MVGSLWLHYGIIEYLWVFIKYQIMSYVLNFLVEVLILTYDLGSTDQAMNDDSFQVMQMLGLEM